MASRSIAESRWWSTRPVKHVATSTRDVRALHFSLISAFCPARIRSEKRDVRTFQAMRRELKRCGERVGTDGERHLHFLLRKSHEQHADYGGGHTTCAPKTNIAEEKSNHTANHASARKGAWMAEHGSGGA